MARPRIHDAALRARLLEAAAEVMADEGVERLSLRQLATACGTSTSAVYSLFGGKAGLVTAVIGEASASFEASQRKALRRARSLPADQRLLRLGSAYRRWALQYPHLYTVMFVDAHPRETDLSDEPAIGPLREVVEACVASGTFRHGLDARATIVSIWASVHGFVMLETVGSPLGSARGVARAYRSHLEGIIRAWA